MKTGLPKSDQRNSRIDYSVPILMYHLVSSCLYKNFREYTIQTDVFKKQMRWIHRLGYKSITLDTYQDWKDGNKMISGRPIIITLDDGYKDCLKYAVPILTMYSLSAVFYLVVDKIGDKSTWNSMESNDIALMDWEGVHEIQSSGFQIGSHTMSHPRLINLSEKSCRKEIFDSKINLENKLGIEIKHFCYPYGLYNEQVRQIVAEFWIYYSNFNPGRIFR